jgi:hypothetical protein
MLTHWQFCSRLWQLQVFELKWASDADKAIVANSTNEANVANKAYEANEAGEAKADEADKAIVADKATEN